MLLLSFLQLFMYCDGNQPAWQELKGEGEGGIWARENAWGARGRKERKFPSSLLPRVWSRALIPFPFPFQRLPRRLDCNV